MWILFVFAAFLSVMISESGRTSYLERESPPVQREGKAIADKFRAFTQAANLYVQQFPTATGSIYWNVLKTANGVPDGYRNVGMPATWRVVADGAGQWVVCAEMSEYATARLHVMTGGRSPMQRAADGKIVFADTVAAANTESLKCN